MSARAKHAIGDPAELAALHAAGAMPEAEREAFEAHLRTCPRCRAEVEQYAGAVAHLFSSLDSLPVSPSVQEKLMERVSPATDTSDVQVWRRWTGDQQSDPLFVQRGADARWEPTAIDGIEIRRLFMDTPRNQMTMLVRMAAGTAYPRHIHDGPEECLVLEGELRVGDDLLRPGDYQRAAPGSKHAVQSTDTGCLLLIVSSLSDELVDED